MGSEMCIRDRYYLKAKINIFELSLVRRITFLICFTKIFEGVISEILSLHELVGSCLG